MFGFVSSLPGLRENSQENGWFKAADFLEFLSLRLINFSNTGLLQFVERGSQQVVKRVPPTR